MKIAIIGSSGYISTFLIEALCKVNLGETIKIGKSKDVDEYLDLEQAENFNYCSLDDVQYIIFTAAISSPDMCSAQFEKCWDINVFGTKCFIREALNRNCRVLFFSSDAVFGDNPQKIFIEESITKATTSYGVMKKNIEDEFVGNESFKAIRLSYVLSTKDKFISYCRLCMSDGTIAKVYHPFYRNIISIHDVIKVVIWLLTHWEKYSHCFLNVAGRELVSRVRIADELNRIFNNKLQYTIIKPDPDFYKNRPAITQMKSLYLLKYNILKYETFSEKLEEEFKEEFGK